MIFFYFVFFFLALQLNNWTICEFSDCQTNTLDHLEFRNKAIFQIATYYTAIAHDVQLNLF